MPTLRCDPQALLIDADDTLWENNIYFERTIAEFMQRLNHKEMSATEVRLFLNQVERETILERGYGSATLSPSPALDSLRLAHCPATSARAPVHRGCVA